MSAALTYIRPENTDEEIEWEAINAAEWKLVDNHDEIYMYESLGFDGSLALVFADDEASKNEDWSQIYLAQFLDLDGEEWVWYWPNG